jgi:hypothetical protein
MRNTSQRRARNQDHGQPVDRRPPAPVAGRVHRGAAIAPTVPAHPRMDPVSGWRATVWNNSIRPRCGDSGHASPSPCPAPSASNTWIRASRRHCWLNGIGGRPGSVIRMPSGRRPDSWVDRTRPRVESSFQVMARNSDSAPTKRRPRGHTARSDRRRSRLLVGTSTNRPSASSAATASVLNTATPVPPATITLTAELESSSSKFAGVPPSALSKVARVPDPASRRTSRVPAKSRAEMGLRLRAQG